MSCFVYKVIRDLELLDHCVLILSCGYDYYTSDQSIPLAQVVCTSR